MHKLLIIEDEKIIRENIKDIFQLYGNIVYTAENGKEGIEMATQCKPDIILCDIMMPGIDGFSVKRILDADKCTSAIPFIFLTAVAEISAMQKGMNLGADDYIVKPFKAAALVDSVMRRLKRIEEFISFSEETTEQRKLSLDDTVLLNTGKERRVCRVSHICMLEVKGDYTTVVTVDGKNTLVKKTIKSWEDILPVNVFVRANRNTIINLHHIEKIETWFNGTFIARMKNISKKIEFSKRYSSKIKKMFKGG